LVWVIGFCNDCCWLLVTGDWHTRLLKKSGVILNNESPRRERTGYLDELFIFYFAAGGGELIP